MRCEMFCFYTPSQYFSIFKRLFLLLPSWYQVYKNRTTEQLLTHSSVPKEHPIGCFLVPVPIDNPASRYFPLLQVHLCFYLWGVRDTPQWKQGNTCTRSLPLTRPYRTGRFFCAFSRVWEWYFHLLKLFSGYCF